jgi:hypothetical protein
MGNIRLGWAVVAGLAAGIALAWWLARDAPGDAGERQARAEQAAATEAAKSVLYRWTDAAGVVHVTADPPPPGQGYETVDFEPRPGIEVDGSRR